jgi:hypothetical protein
MFSIAMKQRNTELHGTDGAISMEQRRKETATEAVAVYQSTIGKVYNQKRNLKTPIKTRTLHLLSEPYDSRSTTHTAMQPRKDKQKLPRLIALVNNRVGRS